jgi:hypothetical protein
MMCLREEEGLCHKPRIRAVQYLQTKRCSCTSTKAGIPCIVRTPTAACDCKGQTQGHCTPWTNQMRHGRVVFFAISSSFTTYRTIPTFSLLRDNQARERGTDKPRRIAAFRRRYEKRKKKRSKRRLVVRDKGE